MGQKLPEGTWMIGKKWYGICQYCKSAVRIDKPLIGGFHLCLPSEERDRIDAKEGE
jgi:hypothetical protein